jgi:Na+/H+ antiporter NhaD/arsenite permease-like protein
MAIGVNYSPFSLTFAASLAGLGWREDLHRLGIHIRRGEFVRVNIPLIAFSMAVSCAVLVGEVYISRHDVPYSIRGSY